MDVSERLNIGGYLVTKDIQKAFDSVNHSFLSEILKALGFGKYFLRWIEISISRVIY